MKIAIVFLMFCVGFGCGAAEGAPRSSVDPSPTYAAAERPAQHGSAAAEAAREADAVKPAERIERAASPSEPASKPTSARLEIVTLDPAAGALQEQLFAQSRKASAAGKRVYLELWATWCPPCKRVHALLADPAVAAVLEGVVVIRADTDAFEAELNPLGFRSRTIPAVYELDKRGRPSGRLLQGHRWKTAKAVRDALPKFLRG